MNQINRDEISTLLLSDRFGEVRNVMFSMVSLPNQHEPNAHFYIPLSIFSYADNYKHHFLKRSEDTDASMPYCWVIFFLAKESKEQANLLPCSWRECMWMTWICGGLHDVMRKKLIKWEVLANISWNCLTRSIVISFSKIPAQLE